MNSLHEIDWVGKIIGMTPDMLAKSAMRAMRAGQQWDRRTPIPPGLAADRNGILFELELGGPAASGGGHGASWDAPSAVAAASSFAGPTSGPSADQLLAEAKAAGWTPTVPDAGVSCGQCTPCRSRMTSQCIRRGTREAAAMKAADNARNARQSYEQSIDGQLAQLQYDLDHRGDREWLEQGRGWVWTG